jgi:hypothetical protein
LVCVQGHDERVRSGVPAEASTMIRHLRERTEPKVRRAVLAMERDLKKAS